MRFTPASLLAAATLFLLSQATSPTTAAAQQPLADFLRAARERALDVREARAALAQAQSQVDEARGRLLPSATSQASYQRNFPVININVPTGMTDPNTGMPITQTAVIQPGNQMNVNALLTVPLIDLSAWAGFSSAKANVDAVEANQQVVQENVSIAVAQLWYALVAQRALVEAAQRNLDATQKSRDAIAAQVEVGVSGQLELSRAEAELARAKQSFEEAKLQATLTARDLTDLTGLTPSDGVTALITTSDAPAPLEDLTQEVQNLATVRAAREQARAADLANDSAWRALLPSLAANTSARWTNAAGFAKQYSYYAGVSATWALDFVKPARIRTTDAAMEGAQVRALRAEQQAQTAIFDAWHRVETSRTSVEAMLIAQASSQRAVLDATARYESGTATQLDLIQAQRDAFQADVAVIQAVANLHVARTVLDVRLGNSAQ